LFFPCELVCAHTFKESNGCPRTTPTNPAAYPATALFLVDRKFTEDDDDDDETDDASDGIGIGTNKEEESSFRKAPVLTVIVGNNTTDVDDDDDGEYNVTKELD